MAVVLFTLPLLGDITLGTALGVGGILASLFMSKKNPVTVKAMTSAWGETWPIVYNSFRVPGKVIQAGELSKVDVKMGPSKKTTNYSLTFAVGICEGTVSLSRIWADNQVIYDARAIANPPNWQANHLYAAGDRVFATGVTDWVFTATVNGLSGGTEPGWNFTTDGATRDNEVVWLALKYRPRNKIGKQYNYYFTFYDGSEDQLADSNLEEIVGVGNQPAYRGVAYIVFISFDLTRYGNRIPNFEFEVQSTATSTFNNTGQVFGLGGGGIPSMMNQFLEDDSGNIYNIPASNQLINIETVTVATAFTTARGVADAIAFGCPSSLSGITFALVPLVGKYCVAIGSLGTGGDAWSMYSVLYEINTDGTLTALGAKQYMASTNLAGFGIAAQAATILPASGEIAIAGGTGLGNIWVFVFDTIAEMQGSFAVRLLESRLLNIAEVTGSYGATPYPYDGYCLSFIGSNLYITLNKAIMDWQASHSSGIGFCSYYKTLSATYPNGVMLRAEINSLGAGVVTYLWNGVVNSIFGWPFADEGLNRVGSAGQTGSATYDCWSPPRQVQEVDGTVDGVYFVRGYSDAGSENVVSVQQFTKDGAFVQSVDFAPFGTWSTTIAQMSVALVAGSLYMGFRQTTGSGTYWARIGAFEPSNLTLADICADVSERVGLISSQYNYIGLSSVIPLGVGLLQRDTARSFVESMMPAYFFDLTDIGSEVVGSLRSNDTILQTIPEADLAAVPGGTTKQGTVVDMISSVRNDDLEIPKDLSISYYDYQHDYQHGSQQARRGPVTQFSSGKNTVSVPVVMTPWDANNAAQRGLFLTWVERIQRKFILPPEYLARTAVDVVQVQRGGRNYVVRISRVTIKPNWTLEAESVSEDLGTYTVEGAASLTSIVSGSFTSGTINPVTTPTLAVMDTATLRPDDLTLPGVYVAAANSDGGVYDTVTVQESPDDSVFSDAATLANQSAIGTVAVALGAPANYALYDTANTLTVSLLYGTLASASKWALSTDLTTNLAWLSNGEIIQFATATLNGDGTYTLSGLRRGRLGTEQFVGTHGANETFVMLTQSTLGNVTYSASDIGATRYWQGLNDAAINPASAVQTVTMTTRRLMPYAPSFLRSSRDGSQNLTITGKRRTRWHGQPLWSPSETDTPVTVEVDIMNGATVVRTLTTTLSGGGSGITNASAFTAYYSAADQVTDFGSAQASVSVKAYSRNATVGRGYGGARTL